jgi:hypothetical protein
MPRLALFPFVPDLPRSKEVSALFTRERNLPALCDANLS